MNDFFKSKENWHKDRAHVDFAEKIKALDRLLDMTKGLSQGKMEMAVSIEENSRMSTSHSSAIKQKQGPN